jgi:outer membrane usher protein
VPSPSRYPKAPFAAASVLAVSISLALTWPAHAQRALAPQTVPSGANGAPVAASAPTRLNQAGRDIPLGGPLLDGGFVLGEISYVLTTEDRLMIDAAELLRLLAPVLGSQALASLDAGLAGRPSVSDDELAKLGYPVRYDPTTFGLSIDIDPAIRPRQAISIAGGLSGLNGPVERPQDFSAYLTVLGNLDYVHRGFDRGLADPNLLFDSAIRYRGFVLENEATLQRRFVRDGTRLVYDDQKRTARYAAGDLRPVSRGFSGATPMAGLSIERVYADLDPQRNIQPRGQRSFTLTRASTVETYINGSLVQQTRLNPGTYDIRDFPFAQGANDIRLVLRDDAGVENVIDFSINFDRTLLAPGITEFGVYAGVVTPFTGSGRRYSDRPTASGFVRRGMSQSVTAGGNFQVGERGGVAGAEVVWATPLGTIGFDLAASKVRNVGEGYALNIGYERNFARSSNGNSALLLTYQTTSRNFATPETIIPVNMFAHEFGATYSQGFARDHFITADGFYSVGRDGRPDQKTARLTYGWRASTRLFLTSEAAYQDRGGRRDHGIRVALTYRFERRSSMTAEVDTRRDGGRLAYQTSSGRGVGSYNAQAAIDYFDGVGSFNGNANILLDRAEVGAAHLTSYARDENRIVDQRTSVRFGTAIAYTGGSVALSRPIYDSFALVKPHRTLDGASVYVLPNDDEYLSRSGRFGPGVAPDLSSYTPQIITYDVPNAPIGYDLGTGIAQVVPPYRSGYLIEVGSSYSITYTGQLLRPDGEPLSLAAGLAIELAEPDRAPVQMFTNRSGRFALSGLRAGKWRVETRLGDRILTYDIEIPANAQGLVRGSEIKPGGSE